MQTTAFDNKMAGIYNHKKVFVTELRSSGKKITEKFDR